MQGIVMLRSYHVGISDRLCLLIACHDPQRDFVASAPVLRSRHPGIAQHTTLKIKVRVGVHAGAIMRGRRKGAHARARAVYIRCGACGAFVLRACGACGQARARACSFACMHMRAHTCGARVPVRCVNACESSALRACALCAQVFTRAVRTVRARMRALCACAQHALLHARCTAATLFARIRVPKMCEHAVHACAWSHVQRVKLRLLCAACAHHAREIATRACALHGSA
eukprot:6179209-Pleurochrysis_carterae.AAC.1